MSSYQDNNRASGYHDMDSTHRTSESTTHTAGAGDPFSTYPPAPQQHQYYSNQSYDQSMDSIDNEPLRSGDAGGVYGAIPGGVTGAEKGVRGTNAFSDYGTGAKKGGMSKGKWWAIAAGALVVVAVAVGAGVALTRKKSGDSSSSSSSSGTSSANLQYIDGTSRTVKSDPKDPSIFEKDDRFHKSFYAMAYTPFNALEPWCGATLANVTEDIQILSQLTTRLRLYGSACGAADFTLQAIKDTKVNMTVWLGAYVGDNTTVNAEQQQWIVDALKKHGTDNVEGVTIGNEYLLNSADETTAVNYLVQQMNSFRTTVNGLGLTKTIPVGTADAGSKISLNLVSSADFFLANVHPFFGGLPVEQAGNWTWDYFTQTDQPVCAQASNKPTCIIAETGWPTNSMTAANMTYQAATAGIPELQTFLDTFVCLANQNGTQYFYFEPFDEPWKEMYGGVEPYWGLLDHNRKFKNGITLPNCPIV